MGIFGFSLNNLFNKKKNDSIDIVPPSNYMIFMIVALANKSNMRTYHVGQLLYENVYYYIPLLDNRIDFANKSILGYNRESISDIPETIHLSEDQLHAISERIDEFVSNRTKSVKILPIDMLVKEDFKQNFQNAGYNDENPVKFGMEKFYMANDNTKPSIGSIMANVGKCYIDLSQTSLIKHISKIKIDNKEVIIIGFLSYVSQAKKLALVYIEDPTIVTVTVEGKLLYELSGTYNEQEAVVRLSPDYLFRNYSQESK